MISLGAISNFRANCGGIDSPGMRMPPCQSRWIASIDSRLTWMLRSTGVPVRANTPTTVNGLSAVLGAKFSGAVAQRNAVADLVFHPLGDLRAQHGLEQAFETPARGERREAARGRTDSARSRRWSSRPPGIRGASRRSTTERSRRHPGFARAPGSLSISCWSWPRRSGKRRRASTAQDWSAGPPRDPCRRSNARSSRAQHCACARRQEASPRSKRSRPVSAST